MAGDFQVILKDCRKKKRETNSSPKAFHIFGGQQRFLQTLRQIVQRVVRITRIVKVLKCKTKEKQIKIN